MSTRQMRERLIVALDITDREKVLNIIGQLSDLVEIFKVGYPLYFRLPEIIPLLHQSGKRVFLDCKLHDIPYAVARACEAITQLGVFMFTVHISGGKEMLQHAVEATSQQAYVMGTTRPLILGVTVLTSIDSKVLKEDLGINLPLENQVVRMAHLAWEAGLGGVVASPREVSLLRREWKSDFLIVTPGIRPAGISSNDQARIMTPGEAIAAGADFIVVGRPIVQAEDPREAARKILQEMEKYEYGGD